MKRYIDANAIRLTGLTQIDSNGDVLVSLQDVRNALAQTPTAEVVEVIRCRDCVHWGGTTYGFVCRKYSGIETKVCMGADHYCSYGERREK